MHHLTKDQSKTGLLRRNSSVNINDTRIAGLYDLEHTIGKGHFAVVKLGRHIFTGEKVAVKVIDKTKLDPESSEALFNEVRCMKLVQHPNIVRLYEVIDTQTKLFLILELGDYDMYDYIMKSSERGCKESEAQQYFSQIIKAIDYCHRLFVVHRDLKPENVVFFEKLGMVKLTDFGFSNLYTPGQQLNTSCGSLAYSAPEILLGDAYDAVKVDVWSLGVILFMLVCGRLPFQEANESETLTRILDCRYSIPESVSSTCKDLIQKMLIRDPTKRANVDYISNSPWTKAGDKGHAEALPLISRTDLPDQAHETIVDQMVAGGLGTEDNILNSIDNGEYSYLTATYYLLAEKVLAAYREEQALRLRELSTGTDLEDDVITELASNSSINSAARSRSNSWRGPSARRACTILKEESEEEMTTYLRSSSRQSSRNSSPSVAMFGPTGLRSSRDRVSPQAIQELLEFSRLSSMRRAPSPESRYSSRSPSPTFSSGRVSPAVSTVSGIVTRLKSSSLLPANSGMRKLSSSPHLLGICEETEESTSDALPNTFYTVQTHKSSLVGSSMFTVGGGKSNGSLGRGFRSASTGFAGRNQRSMDSVGDLPTLPERASSSASNPPIQSYSSLRMVRPKQTIMSPDICKRYEQHQRFISRSKRSTSCSSESSDDEERRRKVIGSATATLYCKRNNFDKSQEDDDPPPNSGQHPPTTSAPNSTTTNATGSKNDKTGNTKKPSDCSSANQKTSNMSAADVPSDSFLLQLLCVK